MIKDFLKVLADTLKIRDFRNPVEYLVTGLLVIVLPVVLIAAAFCVFCEKVHDVMEARLSRYD